MIRSDVVENQEGVPLFLDIQIVDSKTCKPAPEIYMDIWHCNATVCILSMGKKITVTNAIIGRLLRRYRQR